MACIPTDSTRTEKERVRNGRELLCYRDRQAAAREEGRLEEGTGYFPPLGKGGVIGDQPGTVSLDFWADPESHPYA